jgi:hypothetical protein
MTAAAVVEAKDEVLQRKRELDATKDRMDTLVERLYGHREANISLSGTIGAAAGYQQVCCLVLGAALKFALLNPCVCRSPCTNAWLHI